MKTRLLLAGTLALTACGPRELNEDQRRYLTQDAEAATEPALALGPAAMAFQLAAPDSVVNPSRSAKDNATRIAEHLASKFKFGCSGGNVLNPTPTSVQVSATRCWADGREWRLNSLLEVAKDDSGLTVTWDVGLTDSVDKVSIGFGTRAVKRVAPTGASTLSVESSFLGSRFTFEGAATIDPSTGAYVLNGSGTWQGGSPPASAVTIRELTWNRPCAPEAGSLDFAPLDVLVTEAESIPVTRSVRFSASSPLDGAITIQVGETTQQGEAKRDPSCWF